MTTVAYLQGGFYLDSRSNKEVKVLEGDFFDITIQGQRFGVYTKISHETFKEFFSLSQKTKW